MPACSPADRVATWRDGEVTEAELASWQRVFEILHRPTAIRQLILTKHLASAARADGLDRERAVAIEMEATRQRLIWTRMKQYVTAMVQVDAEEISALRQQNPKAFHKPRKLRLRNIYFESSADPAAAAATRRRLEALREELLAGGDFEAAAKRESESQTRFTGGRLGYLDPTALAPAVAEGLADMQVGDISQPIETGKGISIFKCEGIRAPVEPSVEEVEAKIRKNLLRLRQKEAWTRSVETLRGEVTIEQTPQTEAGPIAINGRSRSEDELDAIVANKAVGMRVDKMTDRHLTRLLNNWGLGELMMQKAEALGFDKEPEIAEAVRWKIERILAGHELNRRIRGRISKPTEVEAHAFFEANKKRYLHLPAYLTSVILFTEEKDADAESIHEAQAVVDRIEAGRVSFAEAARKYSVHQSAARGGDLGWSNVKQLAAWGPEVLKSVRNTAPGKRTHLLRTSSGYCIFEVADAREATPKTWEEAKIEAETNLYRQRSTEAEETLRKEILEELSVRIIDESNDG